MWRAMTRMFANWSICTSPVWAIVLLLLSYGHSENFDFTKCDISDNFQAEYISATYKTLDPGLGCETNATSKLGYEVHIIVVNPPMSDNNATWAVVKLSIHSRRQANLKEMEGVNFQEDTKPAIFVLHSPSPVRWKVEMYGINRQQKHNFVFSKESKIHFQRKRTREMAKTLGQTLPKAGDNNTIYNFVQNKFGGVTSYSETSELGIKFYIGRDASANTSCDVGDLSSSNRLFSYKEAVTPITGCISKRRNHHVRARPVYIHLTRPVYIIELLEPPEPSPGMLGVDLEILLYNGASQRSEGDFEKKWHFYLVVKAPPSLRWTLHSKKHSGLVEIVAEKGVDVKFTGLKLSTVAFRADEIKATGTELVEWSQHYIAPVHIYAGIHAANSIKLKVPPLENNMASTRDYVTVRNDYGQESKENEHEDEKSDKFDNSSSLIKVTCSDQGMEVAVPKRFFQITGLDKTKLSLRDLSCGPVAETDDYIILCTELTRCGTQSHSVDNFTSYSNVVMIETPASMVSSILQDELGSGFPDEDTSSGSRDLNLVMDDEDYHSNPVSFPVECKLPAVTNQSTENVNSNSGSTGHRCGAKQPQAPAHCSINFYTTDAFLVPRKEFPISVAKNSTVFLKAEVDQDVSLLVNSCWFSTSRVPDDQNAEVKVIISQGCRLDYSVSWMDDLFDVANRAYLKYARFKVVVMDWFRSHSSVYLHCQLYTCQKSIRGHSDQCAVNINNHCRKFRSAHVNDKPTLVSSCGPLTIGPLDLTDKEVLMKPFHGGFVTKTDSSQEVVNHGHQQRIIIEGLDSATVVGIAFAAFVIGIILMGALWFIHTHTGPKKRVMTSPREPEANGDITPNSLSPVAT
ncbi:hypothetical protein BsWGS_08940 [Bradybaena similaris]